MAPGSVRRTGRVAVRGVVLGLLAPLLVLVAAATASADDGEPVAPDAAQELAERWAPVMRLVSQPEKCGSGEPYPPSDVDVMFDNPTIALRGPWTDRDLVTVGPSAEELSEGLPGYSLDLPGDPLDPGCSYEHWADDQWEGREPTIYARVVGQRGVEGRIALQYWFFYAFNDYNNKHETDWERIQLEFEAADAEAALLEEPVLAIYSQHYGAERATWGDEKIEVVDETHPVVYVSAGSHASQYSEGVFIGNSAVTGFGCDNTVGPHDEVRPVVRTIPADDEAALEAYPWTGYEGHWGERGARRFYDGPTGPNEKQSWHRPFAWSEKARPSSFGVPGSDVASSDVAQTYCDTIAWGSDRYRAFVASPGPVLGVLAVLLLVVAWLLRRSRWHTAPVPLRERRSGPQAVAGSLMLLRRHPWPFLQVALPPFTLALVIGLLRITGWVSLPRGTGLVSGLGELVLLLLAAGATAVLVDGVDRGEPLDVRRAHATATRRLLRALPALAVAALAFAVVLGSVVASPLALVLLILLAPLVPSVVIEGSRGFTPVRRSVRLARDAIRTWLTVVNLAVLVTTVLGALIAALLLLVVPLPLVVLNAVPPLVVALVWPLVAVALTYAYGAAVSEESEVSPRPVPAR